MPDVMPSSVLSSPMFRRETSAAASSNETSVKTAMGSERQHVPDALAGGAAGRAGAVGQVARTVAGDDLVALLGADLGRDGDALDLSAHPQLLDARAFVFDDRAGDFRFEVSAGRRHD